MNRVLRCLYCKETIKLTLKDGWTSLKDHDRCTSVASPDRKHTPGIPRLGYTAGMRIQSTDDYQHYLKLLGTCTAACQQEHCGLIDQGCGLPPGKEI